jgi:sporulation protein YlmC with PRC-barrel domain
MAENQLIMNQYRVELIKANLDTVGKLLSKAEFYFVDKSADQNFLIVHSSVKIQGLESNLEVENTSTKTVVIGFKPVVEVGDWVILHSDKAPTSDMVNYIKIPAETGYNFYLGQSQASKSEFYNPFDSLDVKFLNFSV